MKSNVPDLLFLTNPENTDPEEDEFLSKELDDTFNVTLATPKTAINLLPNFPRCLMRNAWPSRLFVPEFEAIEEISKKHQIRMYNPIHRGYREDKTYIPRLWQEGYPVIPTVRSLAEIELLPSVSRYVIKPNRDSGSSFGVEYLSRQELEHRQLADHLIQPEMDVKNEISFYFIDDVFQHAMVSEGKGQRWQLVEYPTSPEEVRWAERFVQWNGLPYGMQRIDACRLPSGELLLMEVENHMVYLSLLDLSESTRKKFCSVLKKSLLTHLV